MKLFTLRSRLPAPCSMACCRQAWRSSLRTAAAAPRRLGPV